MTHLPDLIIDLGALLITAAAASLLFRHLRLPSVLGYLIAGFILGPHFPFFHTVRDPKNIAVWADLGVIFMLFSLGLEFSFRRLARVGMAAFITACFEIPFMVGLGYAGAQWLGWTQMDSLFLGGILAISSTAIILRAVRESGHKSRGFVGIVLGVLVIEDLVAILLLVLLSSVAVTKSLSGLELLLSSMRLGFFLVLWFLLGLFVLPFLMRKFKRHLGNETLLIVSLGLCLCMVMIASSVGFSPALGAFVMGSLLAETKERERIEHLIAPLKDLFSALFFVSVGMLIDPAVLARHPGTIAFLTATVWGGKFFSASVGALVSGRSLKDAVRIGLSLTQIGEFSCIIATLGVSLGVTSGILYPIAVAISVLTTSTTPFLLRHADPLAVWIEARLPHLLKQSLFRYQGTLAAGYAQIKISSVIWKDYGVPLLLNGVVVMAINLFVHQVMMPYVTFALQDWNVSSVYLNVAFCLFTLLLSSPFLWAIFVGKKETQHKHADSLSVYLKKVHVFIAVARFLVGCGVTGFVVSHYTSPLAWSGGLLITITAAAFLFFTKLSAPLYDQIEKQFMSHLNENQKAGVRHHVATQELAPWNASLASFVVSPESPVVALNLREAALRERCGVTVAMIDRGNQRIMAPKHTDLLLPYDKVYVIGTDEQHTSAQAILEVKGTEKELTPVADIFRLVPLSLGIGDAFIGNSIRDSGIREAFNGVVVGIERHDKRFLNPDSSMVLLAEDLVWIVGDRNLVKEFRNQQIHETAGS